MCSLFRERRRRRVNIDFQILLSVTLIINFTDIINVSSKHMIIYYAVLNVYMFSDKDSITEELVKPYQLPWK